jgi:hypothetical protein
MPRLALRPCGFPILLLALVAVTASHAADMPPKIDEATAGRLAAEAYGWNLKYMDFYKQDHSFFVFAALGGEYGTAPVGWLGVNPWTGDVWSVWRCSRLSTRSLRKS